jgi:hypothetical protein
MDIQLTDTDKKQLSQLLIIGCIVVGFVILRNENRKKARLLDASRSMMPQPPVVVVADVINPNSNTDNVTPVDTYDIVKSNEPPLPDTPPVAPATTAPLTQQEQLVANLWNAVNAGQQETNLEKATRFLVMKNIDPSSLEDSTPQGIVNYAFANGWNPNA